MKLKKISNDKLKQISLEKKRIGDLAAKDLPTKTVDIQRPRLSFPMQFSLSGNRFTPLDEW